MPNDSVNNYIAYFRNLAITHKDIQHNPASETGSAPIGSKRFTRWGVEEVVTGLRTNMGWPALLLELYETTTTASNAYDIKGLFQGAFSILGTAKKHDFADEVGVFASTEKIVKEILQQIWTDMYGENADFCNRPFASFGFEGIEIIPVGPLYDNQFGWRVQFTFKPSWSFEINRAPDPGTFVNPNPNP